MEEMREFEIIIKPSFEKFYSDDSSYGIYSVAVQHDSPNQDLIENIDDFYRDINLVGTMPRLEMSGIYNATVEVSTHKVYGLQYQVKTIHKKLFSSREEQLIFLKAVLTESQIGRLTKAYPNDNLVDLIKNDELDVSLVNGIGEKTLQKIKDKIKDSEKYQIAIIELNGKFGIPFNSIKRLSDKYGSPDLLIQKINENPYVLTEVDGFGFKRVDEIALSMGIEKTSRNRITSCIEYILDEQANNGHAWIKTTKSISEAIKLLEIRIADVQLVLDEINEELKDGNSNVDFSMDDKGRIYLRKYMFYETAIYGNLKRILEADIDYKVENVDEAISKVEERQGFQFTDEQLRAINFAVKYNVLIVNGKAGTGKTAVIKGIVEVLKTVEDLEYATCALSGKASQRIQESTGLDSSTIHRLLGYNPNLGWVHDSENPLGQDVIILDEASMVNSELFHLLTRAIKNGAKLIVTGDTAQLEPIGVGNVLVDLLEGDMIPSVELTKVHRQAQKSGILSCANMVRDGIKFMKDGDYNNTRLGELEDLYMYPYKDKDNVFSTVVKIAKKYSGDIMDFQILVPMKNRGDLSTQNLNKEMQEIFNKNPEFVDKRRKIIKKHATFLEGDKVIINGNNYDKDIFNGTMGVIEHIDSSAKDGEIVIMFDDVGRVQFTTSEMNKFDLGYAITIHKSQGSQWKFVVLALDYSSWILLNRQSTYTGMTRAVEALFMVVEQKAMQHSINTDNSSRRNTFLPELLAS